MKTLALGDKMTTWWIDSRTTCNVVHLIEEDEFCEKPGAQGSALSVLRLLALYQNIRFFVSSTDYQAACCVE